jgi:hypothetical protein
MKQPVPIFEAHTVKGKLKMLDHVRAGIKRWISTFKDGTKVEIVIRKYRKKRTILQNAYYWAVVVPILADYFGHDNPDDMHNDLKREFNPIKSKIDPSELIGGTTTTLSTEEFFSSETSYIERICRWSAEQGIYIPPPEKVERG